LNITQELIKIVLLLGGIPWELELAFEVDDSTLAYKLEAFIKRMKSKKFIEKLILDTTILEDIIQTKL